MLSFVSWIVPLFSVDHFPYFMDRFLFLGPVISESNTERTPTNISDDRPGEILEENPGWFPTETFGGFSEVISSSAYDEFQGKKISKKKLWYMFEGRPEEIYWLTIKSH